MAEHTRSQAAWHGNAVCPVGRASDNSGALLIADDVGNTVWRVTADNETKVSDASAGPD
jgi:glucose/arabinose dehydrogenase